MSEGFTPGPWRALRWWEAAGMTLEDADAIDDRAAWEAAPYTRIEGASGRTVVACHDLSEITSADARLIAAAPELLEVARGVLEAWHANARNMQRAEPEYVGQARALLARVQGEG